MDDLISRQAAIDVVKGIDRYFVRYIEELPSAQPEPCEDTVSRQRLLSDLKELVAAWKKYPVMAEQIKGVEAAIGYVEAIPSAQPEIIRCKDCRFNDGVAYCEMHYRDVKGNDFCSWAERRQDG